MSEIETIADAPLPAQRIFDQGIFQYEIANTSVQVTQLPDGNRRIAMYRGEQSILMDLDDQACEHLARLLHETEVPNMSEGER